MSTGAYSSVPALLQTLGPSGGDSLKITDATLNRMAQIVRKYRRDAGVITAARQITRNVPERNSTGLITTLQVWVRDHVKYVNDPRGLEMVQTPVQTLSILQGDCDDKATLLNTLLETLGFTTRFMAIGVNDEPFCSHVMSQVRLGTRWINLETILPGVGAGWFPPDATSWRPKNV